MNNYVELTEVYTKSSEYDSTVETVVSKYGLRKIYLNTNHIVYLQEDMGLKEKAHRDKLVPGLNNPLTRFCNIFLSTSSGAYKKIDVVGSPSILIEKATEVENAA